ncbi:hypothetical protein ACOKGD_11770 [Microbacterium phosphatis]|uniref:hypothetical protein n=1 Tax=Microbacterium phosphatis TaxID=3140248 RepID=UPI003140032D
MNAARQFNPTIVDDEGNDRMSLASRLRAQIRPTTGANLVHKRIDNLFTATLDEWAREGDDLTVAAHKAISAETRELQKLWAAAQTREQLEELTERAFCAWGQFKNPVFLRLNATETPSGYEFFYATARLVAALGSAFASLVDSYRAFDELDDWARLQARREG